MGRLWNGRPKFLKEGDQARLKEALTPKDLEAFFLETWQVLEALEA